MICSSACGGSSKSTRIIMKVAVVVVLALLCVHRCGARFFGRVTQLASFGSRSTSAPSRKAGPIRRPEQRPAPFLPRIEWELNNCYMASVTQALFQCQPILRTLFSSAVDVKANMQRVLWPEISRLGAHKGIVREFARLYFQAMRGEVGRARGLLLLFGQSLGKDEGIGDHLDALSFFRWLSERALSQQPGITFAMSTRHELSRAWTRREMQELSVTLPVIASLPEPATSLHDYLYGMMVLGHSVTLRSDLDLSVNEDMQIFQALPEFTQDQILAKGNVDVQIKSRILLVQDLPLVLPISITRNQQSGRGGLDAKFNGDTFDYPLELVIPVGQGELTEKDFVPELRGRNFKSKALAYARYHLQALVYFQVNHYMAVVRSHAGNECYHLDGKNEKKVTWAHMLEYKNSAVLLLYQRTDIKSTPTLGFDAGTVVDLVSSMIIGEGEVKALIGREASASVPQALPAVGAKKGPSAPSSNRGVSRSIPQETKAEVKVSRALEMPSSSVNQTILKRTHHIQVCRFGRIGAEDRG